MFGNRENNNSYNEGRYGYQPSWVYPVGSLAHQGARDREKAAEGAWQPRSTVRTPASSRTQEAGDIERSGAGWKLKLVLAILGALIFGLFGQPAVWPWIVGAIVGWILPAVLAVLGKIIGFTFRLALALGLIAVIIWIIGAVLRHY